MGKPRARRIPAVEWVAGIGSLLIVLGTIGYLVLAARRSGSEVPELTVTVARVRESAGSFVVDVVVRNGSSRAAADVQLAGIPGARDGREAPPRARVDYVPGFSTREASLVFAVNPGNSAEVRIIGYSVP